MLNTLIGCMDVFQPILLQTTMKHFYCEKMIQHLLGLIFFSHHFAMPRHHVTKASLRPSYQFTVWKVVWEKPGPRLPHWVYTGERYMVWAQSQVTHRTVKSKRMIKTLKKVASKIRVSIYFGKHLFEEFVFFPIVDRGVRRWFIFVSDQ